MALEVRKGDKQLCSHGRSYGWRHERINGRSSYSKSFGRSHDDRSYGWSHDCSRRWTDEFEFIGC